MTYSVIARCPHTSHLGVASATFSLACGARNESVLPGVGISKSQAYPKRTNDLIALHLLKQGMVPAEALDVLAKNDPDFSYRQIGMIDAAGNIVIHTGTKARPWAGHKYGDQCGAFGNVLAGESVPDGILAGFMRDVDGALEDRLISALEGGRDAGGQVGLDGQRVIERSAWVRVVNDRFTPLVDLRVDRHPTAIAELRRVYVAFRAGGP